MGRKDAGYRQLVRYVHQEKEKQTPLFVYTHNMGNTKSDDIQSQIERFKKQHQLQQKNRHQKVQMYHEIISFPKHLKPQLQKSPEQVLDVVQRYLNLRGSDGIGVVSVHQDRENIHAHVVLSGTKKGTSQSMRITKKEFAEVKEQLREYVRERFPQWDMTFEKSRSMTDGEVQMRKRGQKPDKERVREAVLAHLENGKEGFEKRLEKDHEVKTYQRNGRTYGVTYKGRKYRFKTLLKGHNVALEQIQTIYPPSKKKNKSREISRSRSIDRER